VLSSLMLSLSLAALLSSAHAEPPTLCAPAEKVRFSCAADSGKIISLCGQGPALAYRFGRKGAVELEYAGPYVWYRENHARSASFNVEFTVGGHVYTVFDQDTLGTELDHGSGVSVRKDGKHLATVSCTGPTTLDVEALGAELPHRK
jgi:hypothetical protein